jgi:fluoroquinolone resistance protein
VSTEDYAEIQPHTHYADRTFKGVRQERGLIVSSEFYECTFVHCSFVETVFRACRFNHCTFLHCDLSLVQVPACLFSATRFEQSKVVGVDWTQADWAAARIGEPIGFWKCGISHSTFIGLSLQGLQVLDCTAVDVDFREADLSRADFGATDLSESLFSDTNLTEADLRRARNYTIAPGRNVLTRTRVSLPEAMALLYGLDIVLVEDE